MYRFLPNNQMGFIGTDDIQGNIPPRRQPWDEQPDMQPQYPQQYQQQQNPFYYPNGKNRSLHSQDWLSMGLQAFRNPASIVGNSEGLLRNLLGNIKL